MTDRAFAHRDSETAYSLAMVNYGLLFASIFFAGLPGLVAVIIAYSQRDDTPSAVRSHLVFQIRIFWVAFGLSLAAGACALAAVLTVLRDLVSLSTRDRIEAFLDPAPSTIDLSQIHVDGLLIALIVGFGLFSVLTALWLTAAPAFGFIRLASQRGIGHSAAA